MAILHPVRPYNPNDGEARGEADFEQWVRDEVGDCAFCHGPQPSGYWRGTTFIGCCRSCASTNLAKLAADAVVGPGLAPAYAPSQAARALREFTAEFWRAVALAMADVARRREA
jgi:hypothetical protein